MLSTLMHPLSKRSKVLLRNCEQRSTVLCVNFKILQFVCKLFIITSDHYSDGDGVSSARLTSASSSLALPWHWPLPLSFL